MVRSLQRYQYEYSQLNAVWIEVEHLFREGVSDGSGPSAAFRVMNAINEWHRDVVGPLRLDFLNSIRHINGQFEAKQSALGCLIADGSAVDPFAADVVSLLLVWLHESGLSALRPSRMSLSAPCAPKRAYRSVLVFIVCRLCF